MNISIKNTLKSLMVIPAMAFVLGLAPVATVDALNIREGANAAQGDGTSGCLVGTEDSCGGDTSLFKTITNVLLFIIGAISVIMLIIGGIRYTISNGDSGAVTNAKNTILYAIIGLIVAILAFALVNFVLDSFLP